MRYVVRLISAVATALSVVWFYIERGIEPAIVTLAGLAGVISSFFTRHRDKLPLAMVDRVPTGGQGVFYRTEVERGLDDLVSHEEGLKFQSLAVILVKQKWPDFIASERKWDLGRDAYAPSVAPANVGAMALACSLTAAVDKIKKDAVRIRDKSPDVSTLIFCTAQKVTSHTAAKWAEQIKAEFGFQLIVVSREDIITSLMDPANAALCATHLGMPVPTVASTRNVLEATREACDEEADKWLLHPRLRDAPLIRLRLLWASNADTDVNGSLDLEAVQHELSLGRRLVLEAPAGAGKTTTLLQLAKLTPATGTVRMIVDLPGWIDSGCDILDFVARSPSFRSRGIEARDLAALKETAHFDFLLNGWNEISERRFESAARRLSELERNYPAAGIIVATRASLIKPPLPGSSRIRVRELSAEQRAEYLLKALGESGQDLVALIQDDHTLDNITRNPLILAEVAKLFGAGLPIPETKLDIINAMAQRIQNSEEHAASFETVPLFGQSAKFLSALAYEMTRGRAVDLRDEEARQTVSLEAGVLVADGQLASSPDPASVLDALCGHHVLERIEYPQTTFRFQHQQFQEFYAALRLIGLLEDATDSQDADRIREFKGQYLDQPVWEESLKMIAAAIGAGSPVFGPEADPVRIGEYLVRWAIPVDPVYAAALSRECGDEVWSTVGSELGEWLRAWYEVEDSDHRRCALAGMLASGSSDFVDIIVPLLTSADQQVRLSTYRALGDFHIPSLGPDWRGVVKTWCDEHRIDFLHEGVRPTGLANIAEELAVTDPSEAVRAEAVGVLSWLGADDSLERVCNQLNDESLVGLFRQSAFLPELPTSLQGRVVTALRTMLNGLEDMVSRFRILVQAAELGDHDALEDLRTELDNLSPTDLENLNDELLSSVLSVVQATHEEWVGRWIAERIASGSFWPERWIDRVATVDQELLSRLVDELGSGEVERRKIAGATALAARTTANNVAEMVCRRLYQLQTERMTSKWDGREQLRSTISRQLEDFARGLPTGRLVTGMLDTISGPPTLSELLVVLGLFGRIGDEQSEIREGLSNTERASLRKALVDAIPFVLAEDDFGGGLKAELAMALALTGHPEDALHIRGLIAADVERCRAGQAARERGERGPMANGAATTWSTWYTKALTWLGVDVAEPILLELLEEPEYETDAAAALARLARGEKATLGGALGLSAGNERAVAFVDEDRRLMYSSAIATRVQTLLQQRDVSENREALTWRLKRLSSVLAHIDGRNSMGLVMRVMALRGTWDGWMRADALDHLLEWGVRLPIQPTLEIVNPAIEHALSQGINDQNSRYLVERLLCILVFVDDPARGLARVREVVVSASLRSYVLRKLVKELGESRSEEALDLLLEFAAGNSVPCEFGREWLDAVVAIDSARSRSLLLGFVESDEGEWSYEAPHDLHDSIGSYLAAVARREPQVKDRVLELCANNVSSLQREILANVVAELGTPDTVQAGLYLIDDHAATPVPYHLLRAIERLLVEHRPYPGLGNAYMLVSRSGSEVRRRLFDFALNDNNRGRSALKLLAKIEGWRFDHGKPMSEPWHPAIDTGQPWPPMLGPRQNSRQG